MSKTKLGEAEGSDSSASDDPKDQGDFGVLKSNSPESGSSKPDRWKALRVRNVKLYLVGQSISTVGGFVQGFAQTILVLRLTDDAQAFTTTVLLQFVPMILLGPWGGLVADRVDNRKLLVLTSSLSILSASILTKMVLEGSATVGKVQIIALLFGFVVAFERPAAQAILSELASPQDMPNAVALNGMIPPVARLLGPVIGVVLSETVDLAWCFALNAVSYLGVIGAMLMVRKSEFFPRKKTVRSKGQLRDGFRYAWATPKVRTPLVTMFIVGTLAFNFTSVMPLMNRLTFKTGPRWLTAALAVSAIGSILGGYLFAGYKAPSARSLAAATSAFGVTVLGLALAPNVWIWVALGIPVGAAATWFTTAVTSLLQSNTEPAMLGRVMALFGIMFLGTTPIGAPIVGFLTKQVSARAPFILAGIATMITGAVLWRAEQQPPAKTNGSIERS